MDFVALGEPDYPPRLQMIDDAMPLLAVRSKLAVLLRPLLAIVGSRNASAAGVKWKRSTPSAPPFRKFCSLGSRARDFSRRNRPISGLSVSVVIVEAARRSGSLITARLAGEQGREVFAVPGSPLDPRAEGTNGLLKQGATLVTEAADIIAVLEPIQGRGFDVPAQEPAREGPGPLDVEPGADERARITGLLGLTPASIDDLVRLSGSSPAIVLTLLLELEIARRLERYGGGLVSLL
jgi:DNA processing protein